MCSSETTTRTDWVPASSRQNLNGISKTRSTQTLSQTKGRSKSKRSPPLARNPLGITDTPIANKSINTFTDVTVLDASTVWNFRGDKD